jgi:hypothetical protein
MNHKEIISSKFDDF